MKHFLLITIVLFLALPTWGQINIGSSESTNKGGGKLSPEDFAEFKKTTTIFIVGNEAQEDERKAIEKAFKAAWKVTPYKVVSIDDGAEYKEKDGYSYFTFKREDFTYAGSSGLIRQTHLYYYQLSARVKGKKKVFANIEMDDMTDPDTNFPNSFQPGFLKCYLAVVSNYLSNNQLMDIYKVKTDELALRKMKYDTLYVPEYILPAKSKVNNKKDEKDPKETMMAKYEFPYRFMKGKDLSDLLMTSDKALNFFVYVGIDGSTYGFIAIFNSQSEEPVFSELNKFTFSPTVMRNVSRKIADLR